MLDKSKVIDYYLDVDKENTHLKGGADMNRMQFESGDGRHFAGSVNFIFGCGIYAEVAVPENASEDYGYLTMKKAIMERFGELEFSLEVSWQYDGQEQYLAADADADTEVYIDG